MFYCRLLVHITDTRAQKVVSYTSAHITETVFAHDHRTIKSVFDNHFNSNKHTLCSCS